MLFGISLILAGAFAVAHGDFGAKKNEYTQAISTALEKFHTEHGEVFLQIDAWKKANAIQVQIYKTAKESIVYECHLGAQIDCHNH